MAESATTPIIRTVWSFEQAKLEAHLHRLAPDDRRARFLGLAKDTTIASYAAELPKRSLCVIGAYVRDELRALGELKPIPGEWPLAVELAITVEREFQNQGLGSALFQRLICAARNRGTATIRMVCLTDNRRIQAIARKHNGEVRYFLDEAEASLAIKPGPTPLTWMNEALGESAGLAAAALRVWRPVSGWST